MKLWIILMVGYALYNTFFKKSPEVLADLPDAQKDTMLVTYSPRGGSGGKHVARKELSEGAKRLMERNPQVPKPFGNDFLDKNAEDIPFTDV